MMTEEMSWWSRSSGDVNLNSLPSKENTFGLLELAMANVISPADSSPMMGNTFGRVLWFVSVFWMNIVEKKRSKVKHAGRTFCKRKRISSWLTLSSTLFHVNNDIGLARFYVTDYVIKDQKKERKQRIKWIIYSIINKEIIHLQHQPPGNRWPNRWRWLDNSMSSWNIGKNEIWHQEVASFLRSVGYRD